jgi:hypothetical protein
VACTPLLNSDSAPLPGEPSAEIAIATALGRVLSGHSIAGHAIFRSHANRDAHAGNAINGRGCSDAKRHGENSGERADAMRGQLSESEGNILEQCEHDAATFRPDLFVARIRSN